VPENTSAFTSFMVPWTKGTRRCSQQQAMLSQALQHVMQMQAGNVQVPDATMEGDDEWANVPPIEPDLGSSRGPEPVDPRLEQLGCLQLPR